ncbi:MAG: hypothetical protein J4N97_03120 [Chloroflexi bacterium]|nr:hypothetical protein [Chloroflexota bacterium]
MAKKEFPPPPDYQSIDTRMMTARELRETLDDLWEWVHRAEMAPESDAPSDQVIQEIRQLMARIISERVDRHADEPGRSAE